MADPTEPADALEDLFERERVAVLGARFDLLERLAAEKLRLTAVVAEVPLDRAKAERLGRIGQRNHRLLQAMARGIERARRKVSALARASQLRTYDRDGAVTEAGKGGARLRRKA